MSNVFFVYVSLHMLRVSCTYSSCLLFAYSLHYILCVYRKPPNINPGLILFVHKHFLVGLYMGGGAYIRGAYANKHKFIYGWALIFGMVRMLVNWWAYTWWGLYSGGLYSEVYSTSCNIFTNIMLCAYFAYVTCILTYVRCRLR